MNSSSISFNIIEFPELDSTNTFLKALSAQGAPEGTVVSALRQISGKGRMGRSFFSPDGTGLYFSVLLRPKGRFQDAGGLTAMAAVAVAEAVEELGGKPAEIKWVNDVQISGAKVCGILTEGRLGTADRNDEYAVVGIGVNCFEPEGGFPAEIADTAAAVFSGRRDKGLIEALRSRILSGISYYYCAGDSERYYDGYCARSSVLGREVDIIRSGDTVGCGTAAGIDRDFRLRIILPDGSETLLDSGEVSVRSVQNRSGAGITDIKPEENR